MRNVLTTMVGTALLLTAACEGTQGPATGGTGGGTGANTGETSSGGTSAGGKSGGVGTTSTGGHLAPPGSSCVANSQCASNICGLTGTGNCCASPCDGGGSGVCAQPADCDDSGQCAFPIKGTACGMSCASGMDAENTCNGAGDCVTGATLVCPSGMCNASGTGCE